MVDVSIIIPVWNAAGLLPRCLDSIVAQTWDHDRIEVVLVDDGSTDGSGDICDAYAREHPMFRVIHQENSGGPAAPRNRGIEVAAGEFLFFCDNDDYFGPEAVQRMVEHARAWGSDVLLLKMGQEGGRDIPRRVFEHEQPSADLYTSLVTSTLGPWKLFRRKLIIESDIRFPEDCSFDDSVFALHAMLVAKTVSVANDYEYYYWVLRSDGSNITTGDVESAWHRMDRRVRGLERLMELVHRFADPTLAAEQLLPKLIGEPFAATLRMLPKYEPLVADRYADELRALVRADYSSTIADELRFDVQLMYAVLLQTADSEGLRNMIRSMPGVPSNTRFAEVGGTVYAEHLTYGEHPVLVRFEVGPKTLQSIMTAGNVLTSALWSAGTLTLSGELTCVSGRPFDAELELRITDHKQLDRSATLPVGLVSRRESSEGDGRVVTTVLEWRCVISRESLEALPVRACEAGPSGASRRWDVNLVLRGNGTTRSIRLGADRRPGVFKTFVSGAMATTDRLFLPDETGMKNISVWEVRAQDDLSAFRMKRDRPPANTEILASLARSDFRRALAIAQAVQAGRFDPGSGRGRRIASKLASKVKAVRRRSLALARKLFKK